MPKAEVGSTKWLGNKMKAKGLQRLRWYCQVCERQMRDANGFKQHTLSEAHVRQMQVVGQDANKYINDYSNQFKSDFLLLLRTSHGEKKININHFYQEYIANKEHVHMNATKWPSLTEFAKSIGREGICRVEEGERGLEIAWVDNSPEALRRQAAIQKRERQDRGDEIREQRLIQAQIDRAKRDAESKEAHEDDSTSELATVLQRDGEERIKLNFGSSKAPDRSDADSAQPTSPDDPVLLPTSTNGGEHLNRGAITNHDAGESSELTPVQRVEPPPAAPKFQFASSKKPKNVFAQATSKNAFASAKSVQKTRPEKPMSEAERIMKEELEMKRKREERGTDQTQRKRIRM